MRRRGNALHVVPDFSVLLSAGKSEALAEMNGEVRLLRKVSTFCNVSLESLARVGIVIPLPRTIPPVVIAGSDIGWARLAEPAVLARVDVPLSGVRV